MRDERERERREERADRERERRLLSIVLRRRGDDPLYRVWGTGETLREVSRTVLTVGGRRRA